jgi:hypothetical protein
MKHGSVAADHKHETKNLAIARAIAAAFRSQSTHAQLVLTHGSEIVAVSPANIEIYTLSILARPTPPRQGHACVLPLESLKIVWWVHFLFSAFYYDGRVTRARIRMRGNDGVRGESREQPGFE